jgi:hypothetical protein
MPVLSDDRSEAIPVRRAISRAAGCRQRGLDDPLRAADANDLMASQQSMPIDEPPRSATVRPRTHHRRRVRPPQTAQFTVEASVVAVGGAKNAGTPHRPAAPVVREEVVHRKIPGTSYQITIGAGGSCESTAAGRWLPGGRGGVGAGDGATAMVRPRRPAVLAGLRRHRLVVGWRRWVRRRWRRRWWDQKAGNSGGATTFRDGARTSSLPAGRRRWDFGPDGDLGGVAGNAFGTDGDAGQGL